MYHIYIYIIYMYIIYICIVDSCVAYLFLSLSLSLSLSVSVSIYLSTNELLCLCIVNMWYVICQMPSNDFNSWTFWAILSWADGRVCNGNHEVLNHDVLGGWMVGGWGHYEFMNLIIWYQGGFTVRSSNQSGSNLFWHPQSKPLDWNVLIATQSRYLLIDLKHRHLLVSGSQGPGSASPWRCLPDLHHRSTWCHGEVWLHAADLGLSAVVATSGQRFQKWGHQLTVNFRMNLFASTFECGTDFVVTHVQDSEGCGTIYIYTYVICLPTCHAMVRGVNQKSISPFQLFKRCGWATSSCSDSLPLSTCRRVRAESPKIAEGKSVASTRSQVFSISNPVLAAFVFPETVPAFRSSIFS